jgi:hypothetical protein
MWLMDVRENEGPLERQFARWTIESLAYFEARERELTEALDKGRRFERAYQESLGATPTTAQWERLESLQSAFLDAYLAVLNSEEPK